jgi:pimeloyl-ACP methyl ester carboxylesterase
MSALGPQPGGSATGMTGADAVPGVDATITLRDGRSLAYAEWGDLTGRPVILFHGMPNSRLAGPNPNATRAAGVRLITIDRPGYGRSDPRPGRTLLDWVDDVAELVDRLRLPPCRLVGWSSGGPYAMACAVRIQSRVRSIGLAASNAPLDEVPGGWDSLATATRDLIALLRSDRAAAMEAIAQRCSWYTTDPEFIPDELRRPGNPDWALFQQHPEIFEAWRRGRREGARQGSIGFIDDWAAECLPWGFSPVDVPCEARLWWGEADMLVGRGETECLARTIPRSALVTYPSEGHLILFTRWVEMLAAMP